MASGWDNGYGRRPRSHSPYSYSPLPSKYERRAPRWDGDPRSFEEFLDEYEDLAYEHGLVDEKMVSSLTRYAPNSDVRYMWKLLAKDISVSINWDAYRERLIENTPGAGEDRRYTRADLEDLVASYQDKAMQTRDQLNEYWQRFFVVVEYLSGNGRLSNEEKSKKFLQGLPASLRRRVQAQLRNQYPTHHLEDAFTLQAMFHATCFVLTAPCDDFEDGPNNFVPRLHVNTREHDRISTHSPPVIQDATVALTQAVCSLATMMATYAAGVDINVNDNHCANWNDSPHAEERSQGNSRHSWASSQGMECDACSERTHLAWECPRLKEYMAQGYCTRNHENRICFPDGIVISTRNAPGWNFLERIDLWHNSRMANMSDTVQINFQDVVGTPESAWLEYGTLEAMDTNSPTACEFLEEISEEEDNIHANEIYARNANVEDIALLEKVVQEGLKKLEIARSKKQTHLHAQQETHESTKNEQQENETRFGPSKTSQTTTTPSTSTPQQTTSPPHFAQMLYLHAPPLTREPLPTSPKCCEGVNGKIAKQRVYTAPINNQVLCPSVDLVSTAHVESSLNTSSPRNDNNILRDAETTHTYGVLPGGPLDSGMEAIGKNSRPTVNTNRISRETSARSDDTRLIDYDLARAEAILVHYSSIDLPFALANPNSHDATTPRATTSHFRKKPGG